MLSRGCRWYGFIGHAIGHTVAALALGLAAYARLGLRDGPLNPYPRPPLHYKLRQTLIPLSVSWGGI